LPSIKKFFNPIKPFSKKQIPALIIVCFLCILWFITYLAVKDYNFDAFGRGMKKMAWAIDHYEEVEKHRDVHPIYGTPAILVTPDNISIFSLRKIIIDDNTVFFNSIDGTPLIYYYIIGSKVEFFNSKGRHPQYGEELIPVTSYFIKNYFLQIEAEKKQKEEEELIRKQELEKQRQDQQIRQQDLDSKRQIESLLAKQQALEKQIEAEKNNTKEQLRKQEAENKRQIDNLLAKQKELERQQVSNTSTSTTQRATNNATANSTHKWIGNVEYYPELSQGAGGVKFINHNDYPVSVFWKLPNSEEYDLRIFPNSSHWLPYHFTVVSVIRVNQIISYWQ
jgi:hypothetical protein